MASPVRLGSILGCFLGLALVWLPHPAGAAPATITVGRLTLSLCNTDYTGYCGAIQRPLDPSGAVPGTLTVGFEYYPHSKRSQPSLGTILPQEGGPGYSSTGTRDFYLGLFAPLRDRRDVLIIDKRGTGLSTPINCPALQTGSLDLSAVAACAQQLGSTAWYFGTAFAVGDIAAVLDALEIGQVDFYGDSYGTFVGQVMAGLEPTRLRSIILDSAYPVRPPDVWFATDWATAWSGIDLSCRRSPSCSSLGGAATARMERLIADLRRQPISGTAPDGNGVAQAVTLDVGALIFLIDSAGDGLSIYRDLDAAARAWLDARDALPLLRLVAELNTSGSYDPADFSYGLYTAVTCVDYPLLYDLRAPAAKRSRQYQAALQQARQNRPDLFAPFTLDEGLDSQVYITPLDSCLPWPAPPASLTPGQPLRASVTFPAVPTLVLSGDLDSVTSPEDAAQTTAQFPNAVHIVVPNLTHVVAGSDFIGCTSSIALRFVQSLSAGDSSCTAKVRPVRTVPAFARQAHDLAPLTPAAGDQTTDEQRRIAAAGLEAVGDVVARYWASSGTIGSGLRGGQFSYSATASGYAFALDGARWTEDVAVTGTVSWNTNSDVITADVTLSRAGATIGNLKIRFQDADINAVASISGRIQGAALRGLRIAP